MTSEQRKNKRRQVWRIFTRKYWRQFAKDIPPWFPFSQENINRMKLGKAPRRLAIIRHKVTGLEIESHVPFELHHPFGYKPDEPQEGQLVVPLWPWEHAECDDDRKFPYEFVAWKGDL